jgi:hypothetical protein
VNIEAVIDMAAKPSRAVKPRAGTDEDAAGKPFRAVVAVGSTGIRSEVIVTVGARRFGSVIDAVLSLNFGGASREKDYGDGSSENTIESFH